MTRPSAAAEVIDLSPVVADEVKYTTCYMCACRCGIKVHLKDGRLRYIEGNRNHPVNKGVLCGKGSAGIMQHYSPARLRKPLLRVGERGAGEFKEIEWEEALSLATQWLGDDPRHRPKAAGLLHRARPEPEPHGLVGQAVRHAELRRAWRVLLGQHGDRGPVFDRRQFLGIRRARLGPHEISADVRRRRGPRFQPDQDRPGQAEGARGEIRQPSIRCRPATRRWPTSFLASAPAPTGCSCWRWCTSCCAPTASIWIFWRATATRSGW